MTTRPTHFFRPALFLAALLFAASPVLRAQPPTEGYDPMRQITAQLMKANLHIVQDVTGSMAWYPENSSTPSGDADGFGYLSFGNPNGSTSCTGTGSSRKCKYWDYTLTFNGPSRMAIVKNALGHTVPLVTEYAPPATLPSNWSRRTALDTAPSESVKTWGFRYTYNSTGTSPARPFTPWETITIPGTSPAFTVGNFPIVRTGACTVGTCKYVAPQDLIGKNAHRVNWGLTTFSTDGISTRIRIDTSDANEDLAELKDYFVPSGATGLTGTQGLNASGSTNTRSALDEARRALLITAAADPKINCDRPYGVLLVTDGLSNSGNPGGDNWIMPCDVGGPTDCDASGSPNDCPAAWSSYAAHWADQLYSNTYSGTTRIPVRTWTIGVSSAVGPCELDYIAYMGRTDASSPNGDAGWGGYDASDNPYLPNPATTEPANPRMDYTTSNYDGPTGQYWWNKDSSITAADRSSYSFDYTDAVATGKTFDAAVAAKRSHGHNAYFAETSEKLAGAITAIVNATGTGDYATNAPVSGMSASQSSMVYLPSTEFPKWEGHIYAFDTRFAPSHADYLKWDAGIVMNSRSPSLRKIFTWDTANSNALVEVTTSNLVTLQSLGGAGITAAVVSFIRGDNLDLNGDGDTSDPGEVRTWRLGPLINSAPALVGSPSSWLQGTTINHKPFESNRAARTPLLWAGSNNGMMHAFRIEDGVEQIALIPPSLLATQVELYDNYVADPRNPKNSSGQPTDTDAHIYGVANSFRFGDVWDDNLPSPAYRTIGVITVGPGGDDVVGVDVTTVPSPAASPYPSNPVKILWRRDSSSMTGLQQTWSIPAMAPAKSDTWRLVMGSGFNPGNTAAKQIAGTGFVQPNSFTLDPTDGTIITTLTLNSTLAHTPFVGSQAFADSVLFNPVSKVYQDDNVATLGLQADLNGRIWFLYNNASQVRFDSSRVGIDASAKVGQSQPIYYNPAASGYGQGGAGCVAYAFGSGALYERSAAITGPNKTFVPRLYVATTTKTNYSNAVPAASIIAKPIRDTATPWQLKVGETVTNKVFGENTQLTAPPFMLVPKSGSGSVTALFLLYDPDEGCHGNSYVAVIEFIGNGTCQPSNGPSPTGEPTFTAYSAGEGAASGFTIAGDKVLVSKSGIGEGQRASLYEPPGIAASVGGVPTPRVKWWKELK